MQNKRAIDWITKKFAMDYQDKPVDLNSNVVYEKTNYKNLNRLKEDTLLNNNSSIKSFLLPTDFEKPTDRKRSLSLTSDPTRKFQVEVSQICQLINSCILLRHQ